MIKERIAELRATCDADKKGSESVNWIPEDCNVNYRHLSEALDEIERLQTKERDYGGLGELKDTLQEAVDRINKENAQYRKDSNQNKLISEPEGTTFLAVCDNNDTDKILEAFAVVGWSGGKDYVKRFPRKITVLRRDSEGNDKLLCYHVSADKVE